MRVAILTPNLRNYPWGSIMELPADEAAEMIAARHAVLVDPVAAPAVAAPAVAAPAVDDVPVDDVPPPADTAPAKKR